MYNKAKPKQTDFFFKKRVQEKNRSSHKIKSNFKFYSNCDFNSKGSQ